MPTHLAPATRRALGFSYVEVLLSVLLLCTLLVPALQALSAAVAGGAGTMAMQRLNLRNKMEHVLSQPYGALYAETSASGGNTTTSVSATFSDATGTANRRVVVLYRYNSTTNALSASDTGLLFVSVYYQSDAGANALNSLAGRWW